MGLNFFPFFDRPEITSFFGRAGFYDCFFLSVIRSQITKRSEAVKYFYITIVQSESIVFDFAVKHCAHCILLCNHGEVKTLIRMELLYRRNIAEVFKMLQREADCS